MIGIIIFSILMLPFGLYAIGMFIVVGLNFYHLGKGDHLEWTNRVSKK